MAITFSITGGADAAKFNINAQSGALTFKAAPDYEAPTDANRDNVYEVEVAATDPDGTTKKLVRITVTDVKEGGSPPQITSAGAANAAENQTAAMTVTAFDPDDETNPPAVWTPAPNGTKVMISGFDWEVESGPDAVFQTGNAIKMIWRYGESWPTDISGGSEGRRAEIDGYRKSMPAGQTFWCAYSLSIDDGPDYTATWLFARQYMQSYNYFLNRSKKIEFARQGQPVIGSVPLVRGKVYHCVDKITPGGSGRVTTWIDGQQVADQQANVAAGGYPKFGLYGEKIDRTTQTIRFDNIEFGQDDLSARITTPKPNTPGWLT